MGQAIVHDFGLEMTCHQDVGRLDVTMHDAFFVGIPQTVCNLFQDEHFGIQIRDQVLKDDFFQRSPVDILHHQKRVILMHSRVVHRHDIWMIELAIGLCLAKESFFKHSEVSL